MFNTLKYSRALEAAGVSREQAEAHMQIMAEIVENDMATKQDLKELEYRLIIKMCAAFSAIATFMIAITAAVAKLF